jgi:glycosyltransferase involved in cell wall biosynthesis
MIQPTYLSLVVPCYNEEEVLPHTIAVLSDILETLIQKNKIAAESAIYFIDDGSHDSTWQIIQEASRSSKHIHGIKLSRNFGHQNALLAGLLTVPGDAVISLESDLQDDPNAIEAMVDAYQKGAEIVYGVRQSRKKDSFWKRITAKLYYRFLTLLGVEIIENHADFRLLGRKVITALASYSEVNLFLRGLIPKLGFPSAKVFYDRQERKAGQSKYPLSKMLALAFEGISSLSPMPLRMITIVGFFVALISFTLGIWALVVRLCSGQALPGWASIVLPIYFLGGIQLLALGIIGEYLAKTYLESKRRPRFIIDEKI